MSGYHDIESDWVAEMPIIKSDLENQFFRELIGRWVDNEISSFKLAEELHQYCKENPANDL